ncbi:MAG TPA: hypothetical protein VHW01_20310 [Polyangiaceae bacterium]|jgi:hypothetical protein|nr:hypothetical protein [Polyangiaceae bacterium]
MPRLTRAERRLLRLSLHALGRALELPVEPSVEDSANMARSYHAPLWRVRRMFRSEAAFRAFVARKLEQADERASVRRIAAIFDAASNSQE